MAENLADFHATQPQPIKLITYYKTTHSKVKSKAFDQLEHLQKLILVQNFAKEVDKLNFRFEPLEFGIWRFTIWNFGCQPIIMTQGALGRLSHQESSPNMPFKNSSSNLNLT